jgi:hypothetical protein
MKSISLFILLYFCAWSSSSLASEMSTVQNMKSAGAGLSYVIPFGDIGDYFKSGFAYNLSLSKNLGTYSVGDFSLAGTLSHFSLRSDDIRESSKLKMWNLSIGIDQDFYTNSWIRCVFSLRPEFYYWAVTNNMSEAYKNTDKGVLLGLRSGLTFSLGSPGALNVEIQISVHTPQMKNAYLDTGLGFAKTF